MLTRLGKIVSGLHPQPVVRIRPAGLLQPDRHFRRDPGLTVNDTRQRMAGHAQDSSSIGHTQAQLIKASVLDGPARVRRGFSWDFSSSLFVVKNQNPVVSI